MASKDTVQGLTAAIEAILAGINKGAEYRRRERYDARAEEDQDLQREYHKGLMADREAARKDRESPQYKLDRILDRMAANSKVRTEAISAILGGTPETAMEELQRKLEAVPPPGEMPKATGLLGQEVDVKAWEKKEEKNAEMRDQIQAAINAVQMLQAEGAGSGMGMGMGQAKPPTQGDAMMEKTIQDLERFMQAVTTGDPMQIKAVQNSLRSQVNTPGTHFPIPGPSMSPMPSPAGWPSFGTNPPFGPTFGGINDLLKGVKQ